MTETFTEATYQGKNVTLNKPFRLSGDQKTGDKTHGVYVKNPDSGNIILVKFGHSMPDRNDNPERKKAFRKRHDCDNKNDVTSPGYWACRQWESTNINKEKMEIEKDLEMLEKQMEAIDKSKNPIEENPENKRNKGTTVDMENIPEDKENDDIVEDKGTKFVKKEESFESLKESLSAVIGEYNSMKEAKVFISNPFEAPPGANVQQGPRGAFYYDSSDVVKQQNDEDEDKTKKKKKKSDDLAKPKED